MENTADKGTILVCISDQQESEIALKYACLKSKRNGNRIALLHILEPSDFQSLLSVSDAIRTEKEAEAQLLLNRMADMAQQYTGTHPAVILKEGRLGETIISTLTEYDDLLMLVLGLRNDSERGPKLASRLTEKMGDDLDIPVLLVPGNMDESKLELLV